MRGMQDGFADEVDSQMSMSARARNSYRSHFHKLNLFMKKRILRNRRVFSVAFLLMILISTVMFERTCKSDATNRTFQEPLQHQPDAAKSPLKTAWNHNHNYSEIVNILEALNETYPSLLDLFPIGQSWQDRTIYCARLTNKNLTLSKPKTLFVGYHHANELISAELPLYFVVWATENYGSENQITRILDFSEVYVIVALNVDGLEIIHRNEWQRKNARPTDEDRDKLTDEDPPDDLNSDGCIEALVNGQNEILRWEGIDNDGDGFLNEDWIGGVDLNRNYGYTWNASATSGSINPSSWDYRGPVAFSEPETRAVMNLANQNDFKYAISFHSGEESIQYPWCSTYTSTSDDLTFRQIAEDLSEIANVPYWQTGSQHYTISGAWDDWMYGNRSVTALSCEIYCNETAWKRRPGSKQDTYWLSNALEFYNPPAEKMESVIQKWLPVFTYISNRTIVENPPAPDLAVTSFSVDPSEAYQGWQITSNLTVQNSGLQAETFNITIGYENQTLAVLTNCQASPYSKIGISLNIDTRDLVPRSTCSLWAEASALPNETITQNNRYSNVTLKVRFMGDVDGDGKVNIVDIAIIAHECALENWRWPCDLNRDEKVNIEDVACAASNFGRGWRAG